VSARERCRAARVRDPRPFVAVVEAAEAARRPRPVRRQLVEPIHQVGFDVQHSAGFGQVQGEAAMCGSRQCAAQQAPAASDLAGDGRCLAAGPRDRERALEAREATPAAFAGEVRERRR
jgi:hypothetical protein